MTPAPDFSRNSLTSLAVISAILILLYFFKNRRAGLSPALLGNYDYELSVVAFYNFNDFFD